jgi:hypothetical protein
MSNIYPMLPQLAVNRPFLRAFVGAAAPCCALGVIEERKRQSGLLALRLNEAIPPEIVDRGLRFGHSLFGTSTFEVVHFAFEFYGFKAYHVLINPNNALVQAVLAMMVESGGYFFFVLNPDQSVTAFRSDIGTETLAGLQANLSRLKHSRTTDADYRKAVSAFEKHPQPPGEMLQWVCRNDTGYLDLTSDRLELTPGRP